MRTVGELQDFLASLDRSFVVSTDDFGVIVSSEDGRGQGFWSDSGAFSDEIGAKVE